MAVALSGIGAGLIQLFHRVEETAKTIIDSLIRIFRNVLDWIYSFMYRLWETITDDYWKAIHFFASMWVFMV